MLSFAGSVTVQVGILFVLILVGLVLFKTKLINNAGMKQIIDILFYAVTPCVVIDSFVNVDFSVQAAAELGIAAAFAAVTTAVGYLFAFIFFRKTKGNRRGVLWYATIYSNCGFFSIPLTKAVLGDKGVFLVSVFVAVFTAFVWTVGLRLFSPEHKMSFVKAFINPGMIGIIIGLPLFFFSVKLPAIIGTPVSMLSELNTPLAMIVTGGYLATASLSPKKGDGQMWLSIALRMCIIPLVTLCVFRLCGLHNYSRDALVALMIPAAAPAAANTIMFTGKYGGDIELASRIVPISTLVSIVTVPLLLILAKL